jgi:DNA-directed RNA polymerase specialized sigma24 family protein
VVWSVAPPCAIPGINPSLIAACRAGDRNAFQRLYLLTKDQVYSPALYYFHGDTAAEDVTQDVFIRLYTSSTCSAIGPTSDPGDTASPPMPA